MRRVVASERLWCPRLRFEMLPHLSGYLGFSIDIVGGEGKEMRICKRRRKYPQEDLARGVAWCSGGHRGGG
jgi:hypothetical protein